MRKAFNHYYNIHEIKKQLNDKQYLLFDKALCGVQFLEIHIESVKFSDNILTLLWISIKHTVKSNIEGYCNKMKINYDSLFEGHIDTPCQGGKQGGTQGGSQQEKGKEEEKGKEKEVKSYEKHSDFSLSKVSTYSNLSNEYKIALEKYLKEYIEELELKILQANSSKRTLSYDDFILGLESSGKKYANFIATYKTWNRKA